MKTLRSEKPGIATLTVRGPHARVTVHADRTCTHAELTVALDPAEDGIGRTLLDMVRLTASGTDLTVELPEAGHSTGTNFQTSGDMYVVHGHASGAVAQGPGTRTVSYGRNIVGGSVRSTVLTQELVIAARVPAGSHLHLVMDSGQITATGTYSTLEASLSSAALRVEGVEQASVQSMIGNVDLGRARQASIRTMSGHVEVHQLDGDAEAATVSGNIAVHSIAAGRIQARSMSGSITVTCAPGIHATVEASSMHGSVQTPGSR